MNQDMHFLHSSPQWSVATWNRLFLRIWRGAVTVEDARTVADLMHRFSQSHPEGFVGLVVIYPSASVPDDAVRDILAEMITDSSSRLLGVGYYMPVTGFRGAIHRSVVASLSLISRVTYPTRTFDQLSDAASWLSQRLAVGGDEAAFSSSIERLVEECDPQRWDMRESEHEGALY